MVNSDSSTIARVSVDRLPSVTTEFASPGGEAFVFYHPDDSNLLVKVFHKNRVRTPRRGPEADHLVDLRTFRSGLSPSQSLLLNDLFSWPISLFGSSIDEIHGISIKRASKEFWISYKTIYQSENRPQSIVFLEESLPSKPVYVSFPHQVITLEDRVEIAIEFLRAMSLLWDIGFRYCDYSENNLLWSLEPRPRVFVIDAESCRRPGQTGNRTNGWQPRTHLGSTFESDRSICARLVWRVLTGDMNLSPPNVGSSSFAHQIRPETSDLLHRLDMTGDATLVDQLVNDLKTYRSTVNENVAFDWAVDTGFASLVLAYAPKNPTGEQSQLLVRAESQFKLENQLKELDPSVRTYRLARSIPEPGFEFDLNFGNFESNATINRDFLRQMAIDGHYEEIADLFISEETSIAMGRLATRSLQFALARLGPPNVAERHSASEQVFEWSWPGALFVNCACVELVSPDGAVLLQRFIDRNRDRPRVRIPTRSDLPVNTLLRIMFGLKTLGGEYVACPLWTEHQLRIQKGKNVPQPSTPRSVAVLQDPVTTTYIPSVSPVPPPAAPQGSGISKVSTPRVKSTPQRLPIARRFLHAVQRVFGRRRNSR